MRTLQGEDVGHGKDSKHLAFVLGVGIEWIDCMLSACCLCIVHLGCLLYFSGDVKNSPQKMGIPRSHYKDPIMKQLYHIMSQGLFFMSRGFLNTSNHHSFYPFKGVSKYRGFSPKRDGL